MSELSKKLLIISGVIFVIGMFVVILIATDFIFFYFLFGGLLFLFIWGILALMNWLLK
jgi:hypothetical protein